MRTRHDLPIAWRLGAGLASIFTVMLVLGVVLAAAHYRSEEAQREFATRHVPLSDAASALERTILYTGIRLRGYMLNPGPDTREALIASIAEAREASRRLDDLARAGEARHELEAVSPLVEGYLATASGLANGTEGEDAAAIEKQLAESRERALAAVRTFEQAQDRKRDVAMHAMETARTQVAQAAFVAFALVVGILLFVGFYTFRAIQRPTADLVRIAGAMRSGDWKPALEWSPQAVAARGDRANPRSELARIAYAFGAAAVALDRRESRLRADARVAAATASSLRLESVAQAVLDAMLETSQARSGVFYACEGDEAPRAVAFHQMSADDALAFERQGLPRRALHERRIVVLEPAPGDTALHLSGGRGVPASVAVVPLFFRDEALGVVALAAAASFDEDTRDFLEGAASQVSIGFANVRAHDRLKRLAEEVQAQNEEIQVQNEEIQAQLEEIQAQSEQLQAQNEELHAQSDQIAAANERLNRQAEELRQADERKNEFLGLLAHELRNPLAAISNSIFMLTHPQVQPHQAAQARAVIERQMKHLTRMIDDLLDVTRISRGKLRLQRENLDLVQLVREGLEDHRHAIEHAGLALELDLPGEPVPVNGDRTRLGQVISNLVNNAVKFTERAGRIDVRLEHDEHRATLAVTDTGIGIEPALLEQLFEPFSQGEPAHARPNAGLGLGLALARALVEMHGGHIEAHSAGPHQGAEFVVTLPLQGAAESADGRSFAGARRGGIVSEDFGGGSE